jgi:hypothetical protein
VTARESTVPTGRLVLGGVLLLAGIGWLLQTLDVVDIPWQAALAVSLVLVGVAVLAVGRHGGLVTLGVVLTIILALASLLDVPFEGGIGERTFRPVAATDVRTEYRHAIGRMTVDLTDVDLPAGTSRIEISEGIGELQVVVPDGITVTVRGAAGIGEVVLFGASSNGVGVEREVSREGDTARLELDVSVGIGKVEVRG